MTVASGHWNAHLFVKSSNFIVQKHVCEEVIVLFLHLAGRQCERRVGFEVQRVQEGNDVCLNCVGQPGERRHGSGRVQTNSSSSRGYKPNTSQMEAMSRRAIPTDACETRHRAFHVSGGGPLDIFVGIPMGQTASSPLVIWRQNNKAKLPSALPLGYSRCVARIARAQQHYSYVNKWQLCVWTAKRDFEDQRHSCSIICK